MQGIDVSHFHEPRRLDVLLVSEQPLWPLDQGYRVHGFHMATGLVRQGLNVGVACLKPNSVTAPAALRDLLVPWPQAWDSHEAETTRAWSGLLKRARMRLADHQGLDVKQLAGVVTLVEKHKPSAVLALGQHGPVMLRCLAERSDVARVWYAADEPVAFNLSCLSRLPSEERAQKVREAAVCGAIETLFARGIDGAIGVSPRDTRLLKWATGARSAVTIRNGVDREKFSPRAGGTAVKKNSIVFWGRMDFEPNVDAVCWFAEHVWPALRESKRNATWNIVGKNPAQRVLELSRLPGVTVTGAVTDVREYARSSAAVVLPVRCGAGIKNKLLEAASMGLPIVASPHAVRGLESDETLYPAQVCREPAQWIESILRCWSDAAWSAQLGDRAQRWARVHHDWSDASARLTAWLGYLTDGKVTATAGAARLMTAAGAAIERINELSIAVAQPVTKHETIAAKAGRETEHSGAVIASLVHGAETEKRAA